MKKKDIELIFKGADEQSWKELLDDLRPQGEWKMITNAFQETKCQCNQCKHYTRVGDDRNFCPNCGAKMKGGKE